MRAEIAGMLGFDPAVGHFLLLGSLQGGELILGQHDPRLGDLGLRALQTLLEDLQVMPEPTEPAVAHI